MLAPLAGGWRQAALLPLLPALAWVEDHVQDRKRRAHRDALLVWASMFPGYAWGGQVPDPPDPPDD